MALFKKKSGMKQTQGDAQTAIGFTKQKRFLFFKIRSKPIYKQSAFAPEAGNEPRQSMANTQRGRVATLSRFHLYIAKLLDKHKGLDTALREQRVKTDPYNFVKRMMINSLIVSTVIAIVVFAVFIRLNLNIAAAVIVAAVFDYAFYTVFLNYFINFPIAKSRSVGKDVERDILFAARDIVIGMRSGMPLYNALVTVSSGYGAASREFAKVVELVRLGMPIEQAIENVSAASESKTFKRLMLQASASIKAGADVIGALQETIADVTQERITDLRRYGQRLNALAMFYMLFGVIFPSMGIAVALILTTFISLFTINFVLLIVVLVFILFIQIIFLNIMKSSRPTFAM